MNQNKVVFCDIDYTVLKFEHAAGINALVDHGKTRQAELIDQSFFKEH